MLLQGTFDNLFTAVKDSNGTCQPALCADPTQQSDACQYYTSFFGPKTDSPTAVTLNWDPNMHMDMDTELVPMFSSTRRSAWVLHRAFCFTGRGWGLLQGWGGWGRPRGSLHQAADSICASCSSSCVVCRQYMSTFVELFELMIPYQFVPRHIKFFGHGVPFGVPQFFEGELTPNTEPPAFC